MPADDAVLWRYMDFARFVDLLVSKSLWLSRLDRLDDPREGLLTEREYDRLTKRPDGMATSVERLRSLSYVNCWHQADCESMAMWDLYGAGASGIAIKTITGAIKTAIAGTACPIYISGVKYIDWKQYDEDTQNAIGIGVRKAEGYRQEHEVRLLYWKPETEPVRVPGEAADSGASIMVEAFSQEATVALAGFLRRVDFTTVNISQLVFRLILEHRYRDWLRNEPPGISVSIDTAALIDEVVVGPRAQSWIEARSHRGQAV